MQTLHAQEQNPNPTGMASPQNWGWKFWIGTCAKISTLFTKMNN